VQTVNKGKGRLAGVKDDVREMLFFMSSKNFSDSRGKNKYKNLRDNLASWSKEELLEALKVEDNSGRTLLPYAARDLDALKIILASLSKEELLEAVKAQNQNGITVLQNAALGSAETLRVILELYPAEERLEAVKAKDNQGHNALIFAASYPRNFEVIRELIPNALDGAKVSPDNEAVKGKQPLAGFFAHKTPLNEDNDDDDDLLPKKTI
jgi:ankyrin repeat protein